MSGQGRLPRYAARLSGAGYFESIGVRHGRASLVAAVLAHFRQERPRDGLLHAVGEVGTVLRRHFPRRPDDVNELPDRVSLGPE